MHRLFPFLLFFLSVSAAYSQNFCKKASVYFDLNRSELSLEMLGRIDQLFEAMNGQTVVAELYGYSDSLASAGYNLRLSEKRTAAVKAFIQQKYSTAIRFTEKNLV
jgi:outer membrane protein OmpA-like peptidoglycan-associated protein